MKGQLLIVLMSALGIALALNPATNKMDPGLVKGVTWFLSGILKIITK